MKKLILTTLSLTITSAFAATPTVTGTVTSLSGVVLDATGQALNSSGSCDSSNCSVTTTFPGAGTISGTTLLSQAVTSTETQTISCVAAGHPADWTGSATQTRSFTSQNGVKILGTETAWVTTANTCVAPAVVAPLIPVAPKLYFAAYCMSFDGTFCSSPGNLAMEGGYSTWNFPVGGYGGTLNISIATDFCNNSQGKYIVNNETSASVPVAKRNIIYNEASTVIPSSLILRYYSCQ